MKSVNDVRRDIPLLERIVYFDNTATSMTPIPVIEAMDRYYKEYRANIHRGLHRLSIEASREYELAHEKVANLLDAREDEIVFTSGTTLGINLVALGLNFNPGDKVLITDVEHHSNSVPWIRLAKLGRIRLEIIRTDKEGKIDLADLEEKVEGARLVATHHVSNVLGVIQPVKEIGRIAKRAGALFLVDAAQSVGHMSVDVKEIKADFLALSGHKGPMGPTGIGALYMRKEVQDMVEPVILGGGTVSNADLEKLDYDLLEFPWCYEAGTPNIAGGIGLGKAVEYIQEIGPERIEEHERELVKATLDGLDSLGIPWYGPREKAAVISFNVPGLDCHSVAGYLDEKGIAVRSGHHCATPLMKKLGVDGTVRASYHYYNTLDEVEKMMGALKELVR